MTEVQEVSSEENEEENNTISPIHQEMLIALDSLERFASTSDVTARFTEAIVTVGREITRYFRSRERQRNILEFFSRK